jgi:hypothetical protein
LKNSPLLTFASDVNEVHPDEFKGS